MTGMQLTDLLIQTGKMTEAQIDILVGAQTDAYRYLVPILAAAKAAHDALSDESIGDEEYDLRMDHLWAMLGLREIV